MSPIAPTRTLIVGSGGREHALAWKLASEPGGNEVVVAPGQRRDRARAAGPLRRRRGPARSGGRRGRRAARGGRARRHRARGAAGGRRGRRAARGRDRRVRPVAGGGPDRIEQGVLPRGRGRGRGPDGRAAASFGEPGPRASLRRRAGGRAARAWSSRPMGSRPARASPSATRWPRREAADRSRLFAARSGRHRGRHRGAPVAVPRRA